MLPKKLCEVSDVLAFWQLRSGRNLNDYDAAEISSNFAGFFGVLLEWEKGDRKETSTDSKLEASGETE